ncbi:MAG TPA: DUF3775 domain-containing protein [Pseudolabrys sp.]|jgi:hypothetical protein|nr:DUF3775 domain-containing protein [Pseudolabrys sp.]
MPVQKSDTKLSVEESQPVLSFRRRKSASVLTEPDPGSNPSDDEGAAVLKDHRDNPVVEEFTSFINSLSEDERVDLVTLTWLGQDDYSVSDWVEVRNEAARAHNNRTAAYLLGIPLLGDFLEEGLSMLGFLTRIRNRAPLNGSPAILVHKRTRPPLGLKVT